VRHIKNLPDPISTYEVLEGRVTRPFAWLAELFRAHVIVVAIVCVLAAWFIARVSGPLFAAIGTPAWGAPIVITVLVAVFVVALAYAWYHRPRGIPRWEGIAATAVVTVLSAAIISWTWYDYRAGATQRAQRATLPPSIAVLPFANVSSDADNEPFADGLSEEVLSVLARIEGLKVAGRTSSFYFKGRSEQPEVIARLLKVNHLLEGSVRTDGSRVRITTQLIDAQDGHRLWSQTFDRELHDVFAVQEEIARSVASSLEVRLLPADTERLVQHGTKDIEAYRLYLLARGRLRERGLTNLRAARSFFEEAVQRDPNYAAAHAGLADSYWLLRRNHLEEVKGGEKRATEAAARAIALDPQSSEAHAASANVKLLGYEERGDVAARQAALADYRRAIELDPKNAEAYHWLGFALVDDDRDEALSLFEKALELDPLRRQTQLASAFLLAEQGRYAPAIARVDEVIERYPDFDSAYFQGAEIAGAFGRMVEARTFWSKTFELSEDFRAGVGAYMASINLGDLSEAHRWLARISEGSDKRGGVASDIARLGHERRYREQLDLLEQSFGRGQEDETWLGIVYTRLVLGQAERAGEIVAARFARLADDEEPITFWNCDAALALATARLRTGQTDEAHRILKKLAAWLDDARAPQYPSRWVARAAVHSLLAEGEDAFRSLDRAFDAGYRSTWTLVVGDMPVLLRGEDDPLFEGVRADPRYKAWFDRIRSDNAGQLARAGTDQAVAAGTRPRQTK
ncbi:MAG TPA: tetratricopeptide repeat protein, partial [Steroidobacteraceae bacterium]|nr:tetratricopeptide repeat protein [Steroidobacteraceae bacterium]